MRLKVIIVSPKYQNNLGYIARVAGNFGIAKLHIVNPRAKLTGKASIMYAKHASHLVKNAAIHKSFEDAIKGCDIVIGTTGVWSKAGSTSRKVHLPNEVSDMLRKTATPRTTVALVIGRDDIGLTKDELERCNVVTYIPTDSKYPVLNISHALAIMLFVLTQENLGKSYKLDFSEKPDEKEMQRLYMAFDKMTEKDGIRNRKTVRTIFRRVISAAQPTKREVHALITSFKEY
ncbi:MAG: RNA methyltransferase [Candidatus Micrarchaeales archaeon]